MSYMSDVFFVIPAKMESQLVALVCWDSSFVGIANMTIRLCY